jgi:hypothetical protein
MPLSSEELDRRFDHHPPEGENAQRHEYLRSLTKEFVEDALTIFDGESREVSLFLTSVEEALFWGNAHIARNMK